MGIIEQAESKPSVWAIYYNYTPAELGLFMITANALLFIQKAHRQQWWPPTQKPLEGRVTSHQHLTRPWPLYGYYKRTHLSPFKNTLLAWTDCMQDRQQTNTYTTCTDMYLQMYLFTFPSSFPSFHPSIYHSILPSIIPSIHLSIIPSIYHSIHHLP